MASYSNSAAGTASDLKGKASDMATNLAGRAIDEMEKVHDSVDSAARTAQARAQQAAQSVNEVAGNFKDAVDKSIRDQPLATLAAVAGLAFVMGMLWRSR